MILLFSLVACGASAADCASKGEQRASASARPGGSSTSALAARPRPGEDPTEQLVTCSAKSIARDLEPATWVRMVTRELSTAPDAEVSKRALSALSLNLATVQRSDALALSVALVAKATLDRGDRAGAIELAERAEAAANRPSTGITIDKDEALLVVASVYASAGEHERAKAVAGDDERAQATLATVYAKAGDTKHADKLLAPLPGKILKTPAAQLALVEALAVRGRFVEARVAADRMRQLHALALARIVELAPDSTSPKALLTLAEIALQAADLPIEDWDHRSAVYLVVARRLVRLGEKPRARALRDRVVEVARANTPTVKVGEVLATVATDLADEGDTAGALNTLDSLKRSPLSSAVANPVPRVVVLTRAGRFSEAVAVARELTTGVGFATLVIAARSQARTKDPELFQQLAALACPL